MSKSNNPFRLLPSVNDILAHPSLNGAAANVSHDQVVAVIRAVLNEVRAEVRAGAVVDRETICDLIGRKLTVSTRSKLFSVINATGIILHTNLGRAPMADAAADAAREAARGYVNLEMDLESGKRSSRQDLVREWICQLTGAESATVVNNNAAATIIVLRAIALGKEVIVSRGQLVEIGGSFRIPEIMSVSGAILREVGSTNITRLRDYENAIGPETSALLLIHTSNYRIVGHTESVSIGELIELGKQYSIPVIDDVGSGAIVDFERYGFVQEPNPKQSLTLGADLVLFSGDKLLGGPQCGIIAGKQSWIQRIERDPLMRAFRLDKTCLAALEATLRIYLHGSHVESELPVLRMLEIPLATLRNRAEQVAARIAAACTSVQIHTKEDVAQIGGGSLPEQERPTWVVEVRAEHLSHDTLSHRLRTGRVPVVGRIQRDAYVLDLRTVFVDQEESLIEMVCEALKRGE